MKSIPLIIVLMLIIAAGLAQVPSPALIGYWQNWNSVNAPYIPLTGIDNRYNVINIAFALPLSPTVMNMQFTPQGVTQDEFIDQVESLQNQGKKVLLSIGGGTAVIDLTTTENKNAFINSISNLLDIYGFDGIDIDIEHGSSILITGGSVSAPANPAQVNLIDAIKQIMSNYRATHQKKLLLTMAPETAYVQGGQSSFGGVWGGYLPIIDALRDSLDVLHVQLYNSGSMYGIDGKIYYQGTADFIVAMTEAVIQGFNTSGGGFSGLPASKIAVGLPACENAAGGGFTDTATVKAAIDYLMGIGNPPGSYVLAQPGGYPGLLGMMTWSVNWDAVSTCGGVYQYANNFQSIFGNPSGISPSEVLSAVNIYPNPSRGEITLQLPFTSAEILVTDIQGRHILSYYASTSICNISLKDNGIYLLIVRNGQGVIVRKLILNH